VSFLGNTPEKRKYNLAILLWSVCFIPFLLSYLLRSTLLGIIGLVLVFALAPILILAKHRYYIYLYKKFHERPEDRKKETKEIHLFPIIVGSAMIIVGGFLYILNRNEEIYRLLFGNLAIIGIIVLGYAIYKIIHR
jgi:amino acid transporter